MFVATHINNKLSASGSESLSMFTFLFSVGVAGFIVGVLIIGAFLRYAKKSYADYMLIALLFFLVAEIFIHYILRDSGKIYSITDIPVFINLLFAPVLLFLLKHQYEGDVFSWRLFLHFLFFGLFQGAIICEFFIFPYLHVSGLYELILTFDTWGDTFLLAMYVFLCARIVFSKRFPDASVIKQRVMHLTLVGILFIYFLIACAVDLQSMMLQQYLLAIFYGLLALSLLLVAYIFLCAAVPVYQQKNIAYPRQDLVLDCEKEKYGNNRLPDFIKNSILSDLNHYMNEKRPWIDFNLRLGNLAEYINVNPHQLSQIINAELGKSFACYVNEFRVKNACELLVINVEKSVTNIGLESGFSSKSSFNTIFKKQTGLTPSEYRKNFSAASFSKLGSRLRTHPKFINVNV